MDTVTPPPSALRRAVFEDALGMRHHADGPGGEPLEVLEVHEAFNTESFERALRERVATFAGFHSTWFAQVRTVQRINQGPSKLFVVHDRVPGTRLATVLAGVKAPLDVNATLCLVRQLVAAIALLHEKLPNIAHGAIAPERVIITPKARLVVSDHVLGSALEQLRESPDHYWNELRVPLPNELEPTFDQRADVMQIGILALELILGRQVKRDDYPIRIHELTEQAWTISASKDGKPLPAEMRTWLLRMLQLDTEHAFASAVDAWEDLEHVLLGADNRASFLALESVVAEYTRGLHAQPVPTVATTSSTSPATASASAGAGATPVVTATSTRTPIAIAAKVEPAPIAAPSSTGPATPTHIVSSTIVSPAIASPTVVAPTAGATAVVSPTVVSPTAVASTAMSVTPAPAAVTPEPAPDTHSAAERATAGSPSPSPMSILGVDVDADDHANVPPAPKSKRWIAVAAAILLMAGGGAFFGRQYLMPAAAAEAPGTLVVSTNPAGVAVVVDGQPRGVTPLTVELAPGAHELKLETDSGPRVIPFTVTAGSTVSQTLELPKAAPVTGQLTIRSEPAGARVTIDGVASGATPLTVEGLTPGMHKVVLESDLSSVAQDVTVEAGATASLVVPMTTPQGVPVSGWITVEAPAEVQVFEEGRLVGASQSERIMVTAGRHEFDIVSDALGYHARRAVTVAPGKVTAITLDWPKGSLALNAQPWADVYINGERIGETPIGNVALPIGTHQVTFRHPQLGEQVVQTTVTATSPTRVSVDMRKK